MAKEIVAWCDRHLASDEQVPATTVQVTLDNGMPIEIDLCDPCHKELVEPLRLLLDEHGQPVRSQDRSSSASHCPMPGCDKSFAGPRQLQKHVERIHDTVLPDEVFGNAVPSPASTDEKGETIYPCPEPDCDRTFKRPQAVGAHRSHVHGYVAASNTSGKRPGRKQASA